MMNLPSYSRIGYLSRVLNKTFTPQFTIFKDVSVDLVLFNSKRHHINVTKLHLHHYDFYNTYPINHVVACNEYTTLSYKEIDE